MNKTAFTKHVASLLLFGLNGIVASRIALNSYEIVFFRTFIASIFLLCVFLISKERFHFKENKKDALFVALSGVSMGASWMFLYEAYQQIGVSLATLIYYCGPVIVMVLSPIIFKERLTLPKILGFVIVLVGFFLINENAAIFGGNAWGLFCGVMSAVTYFFMVTFNKKAKKIGGMENTVIQLVVSCFTVAIFLIIKQGLIINVQPSSIVYILILGVINTGVGCYMYFSTISKLSVQTVAVCGYLELLSAVIFATVLLSERMTVIQIIGAVCIVGGAMLGELVTLRKNSG